MKLNQDIKSALILGLSRISQHLTISQINIPKLNNLSIYSIKSDNGEVDITLNFKGKQNVDKDLISLVKFLDEYEYGISQEVDLNNDDQLLSKCCEMLNTFNDVRNQLKNIGNNSYASNVNNAIANSLEWFDHANITDREAKILCGNNAILSLLQSDKKITPQLLQNTLINEFKNYSSEILKTYDDSYQTYFRKRHKDEITDEQIKEEIRLITLATSTNLVSTVFGLTYNLNGIGNINYSPNSEEACSALNFNPEGKYYYFHDREYIDKDLVNFKKDIYSMIFGAFGIEPFKTLADTYEYDDLLGEQLVDTFDKFGLEKSVNLYTAFYNKMDKRTQKIIEGLILNHACLSDVTIPGIPHLCADEITYDRLGDITDITYDYISNNREILKKCIHKGLTSSKNKILHYAEAFFDDNTDIDYQLLLEDNNQENITPLQNETLEDYLKRVDDKITKIINDIRKKNGLPPLPLDDEPENTLE